MRAVLMTTTGTPDVLQVQDVPTPTITDDHEILVRIKAAGVNPVDTKLRKAGTFYPDQLPTILGCDGAGIVEEVGNSVSRFKPGDAVYFCNGGIGGDAGNYAEYATVNEQYAAKKPDNIDFIEAAAAPLVLITAWESLYDRGGMVEGQDVLIHAGAGGVGHVAIQIAKAEGARVCTTVGSSAKADYVTTLGADLPILYKDHDFVEAVLKWTNNKGVELAFDTVGSDTFHRTPEAVAIYGDLVTLLQPDADMDWKQARIRNLRISLELMLTPIFLNMQEARSHHAWILEQCAKLMQNDQLKIHVSETFPLEKAAEAHHMIEQGSSTGKIVLVMDS